MEIVYRYDGSFEGFLSCVFDSYVNKEYPSAFQNMEHPELTLFPVRWIGTDIRHARRVLESLRKIDPWAHELVVKGDSRSASIAAASILAKVSRDRYMEVLEAQYPQYQFGKHKGYGTKLHYEMLDAFGPSPVHRCTFLKKWEAKRR